MRSPVSPTRIGGHRESNQESVGSNRRSGQRVLGFLDFRGRRKRKTKRKIKQKASAVEPRRWLGNVQRFS